MPEPSRSPDTSAEHTLRRLTRIGERELQGLAELLIDAVEGGASVNFMHPLSLAKARAFWERIADQVACGARALIVADCAGRIDGTVHLVLEQPENQPHRADLSKLLVHRRARKHGLGQRLMERADELARDCGKTVLVLDTASADAERLYERVGWLRCGVIPDYALLPNGGLCPATFFYRLLEPRAS